MADAAQHDTRRLVSKVEYARHRSVSPAMVTHWTKRARLVMVGNRVDLEASDAALAASMDQARGGKGGRSDRTAPNVAGVSGRPEARGGGALPGGPGSSLPPSSGPTFSQVQTARVGFVAQRERLRYEREAGNLVESARVKQAVADALGPLVSQLGTLSIRCAPRLLGVDDLRRIQAVIDEEVRKIQQETADTLRSMIAGGLGVRQ